MVVAAASTPFSLSSVPFTRRRNFKHFSVLRASASLSPEIPPLLRAAHHTGLSLLGIVRIVLKFVKLKKGGYLCKEGDGYWFRIWRSLRYGYTLFGSAMSFWLSRRCCWCTNLNWLSIAEEIDDLYLGDAEVWRRASIGDAGPLGGDFPIVTSDGHNILDVIFTTPIPSLANVAKSLDKIDGVVDHGLVTKTGCTVVIAVETEVRTVTFQTSAVEGGV